MGKKSRRTTESASRQESRGFLPFSFLGTSFESVSSDTAKRHILILAASCILMKFIVVFFTTAVFHSFIDYFDIGIYFERALPILQGQIPYINYSVEYPVLLFIPILIAFIPAIITNNVFAFAFTFQFLMVVCDIVTTLCVYLIALKIWDEKRAFLSAILYVTAFSAAYFVITKFDAFPTAILMIAVLFTVYGMNLKGYIAATLGFFVKIFPVIAFPFMILYNAKETSLKEELITALKVVVPIFVVLFLPFVLLNPNVIQTYLFATGSSVGVYANTATNTLYVYLSDIMHTGISASAVSAMMYVVMGMVMLALLYVAYTATKKNPVTLLKLILCAIFALVFFTKFHSPQYIVWFTPFLCLLVADKAYTIVLFYIAQALAYIEFPLMFGSFYTNLEYSNPVGSSGWYFTLFFFTAEYLVLLALIVLTVRPKEGIIARIRALAHL